MGLEARLSIYTPADDPKCSICCDSTESHTCFPATCFTDKTEELAPYSTVRDDDDLLKDDLDPELPSNLNNRAYIWHTFDSPSISMEQMNSKAPRSRPPPGSAATSGSAKIKGPRPIVIFPSSRPQVKRGCVMATFNGGKLTLDQSLTDFFVCGVWPTLAHREDSCVTHIHTTPTWKKSPAFFVAVPYKASITGDRWMHKGQPYYLSAETTRILQELCAELKESWSLSKETLRAERAKLVRSRRLFKQYREPDSASTAVTTGPALLARMSASVCSVGALALLARMSDAAVSEPQSLLLRLQHQSFGEDNREDIKPTKGKRPLPSDGLQEDASPGKRQKGNDTHEPSAQSICIPNRKGTHDDIDPKQRAGQLRAQIKSRHASPKRQNSLASTAKGSM